MSNWRPFHSPGWEPTSVPLPSRRERIVAMLDAPNRLYQGTRRSPGDCVVLVNGQPLRHYPRHSPDGYEWGYEGSGPADLAYALIVDALGDSGAANMDIAQHNHQRLKRALVAPIRADTWSLTRRMIIDWLLAHGRLDTMEDDDA